MAIRGISFNYKASVRLKQSASNSAGFQYQMEINFREQGKLSRWFLSLAYSNSYLHYKSFKRLCYVISVFNAVSGAAPRVLGRSNRTRVKGWNNNFREFFLSSRTNRSLGLSKVFPPVFSSFIDWLTALRNKYTVHTYPNIMETVVDCQTVGRH